GAAAGYLERRDDFRGGLRALHGYRVDEHGHRGKTPRQYVQDVADRGPGRRGNDADAPGKVGQRALALRREEAFLLEFRAQFLELPFQGSETRSEERRVG